MSPGNSKWTCIEVCKSSFESFFKKNFFHYYPKDKDQVWRTYLQCGPCQVVDHTFPQRKFEKIKWSKYPRNLKINRNTPKTKKMTKIPLKPKYDQNNL